MKNFLMQLCLIWGIMFVFHALKQENYTIGQFICFGIASFFLMFFCERINFK